MLCVYFFRELVAALHKQGTDVYLISGGFKRIIQHAAEQLDIPAENIFANRLLFDDEGTSKDLAIMTFIYACFTQMTISYWNEVLFKWTIGYANLCYLLLLGCFAGFDKSEPTSESGGKTRVVKHLKTKFGYKK